MALNLEGLETVTRKVTIGFKCKAPVKLKLANAAGKLGLTLSEYVENIVLNAEFEGTTDQTEVARLKATIDIYENEILHELFEKHVGETFNFTSGLGTEMRVCVRELKDVYTIILNAYRVKKGKKCTCNTEFLI